MKQAERILGSEWVWESEYEFKRDAVACAKRVQAFENDWQEMENLLAESDARIQELEKFIVNCANIADLRKKLLTKNNG